MMTQPLPHTPAHVAALATHAYLISPRKVQLIGLYGDPEVRRALLLMPSGQPLRVGPGDETEAGEVVEIGEDYVVLRRGTQDTTLTMPPLM